MKIRPIHTWFRMQTLMEKKIQERFLAVHGNPFRNKSRPRSSIRKGPHRDEEFVAAAV